MRAGLPVLRLVQLTCRQPRVSALYLGAQCRSFHVPRSRYQPPYTTTVPSPFLCADRCQLPTRRLLSTVASSIGSADEVDELKRWLASFDRDAIPYHSFTVHHARSSGAGGQNVNKVNTKVDMRFVLDSAPWLPPLLKRVLRQTEKGRINARNEFIITSERHRTQGENVDDCKEKMYAILLRAAELDGETSAETAKRVEQQSAQQSHTTTAL